MVGILLLPDNTITVVFSEQITVMKLGQFNYLDIRRDSPFAANNRIVFGNGTRETYCYNGRLI